MNDHKHCYVFADEEKAALFFISATAGGFDVAWRGNAVFANDRVYAAVAKHHFIEPDGQPIWMSDHEVDDL